MEPPAEALAGADGCRSCGRRGRRCAVRARLDRPRSGRAGSRSRRAGGAGWFRRDGRVDAFTVVVAPDPGAAPGRPAPAHSRHLRRRRSAGFEGAGGRTALGEDGKALAGRAPVRFPAPGGAPCESRRSGGGQRSSCTACPELGPAGPSTGAFDGPDRGSDTDWPRSGFGRGARHRRHRPHAHRRREPDGEKLGRLLDAAEAGRQAGGCDGAVPGRPAWFAGGWSARFHRPAAGAGPGCGGSEAARGYSRRKFCDPAKPPDGAGFQLGRKRAGAGREPDLGRILGAAHAGGFAGACEAGARLEPGTPGSGDGFGPRGVCGI